MSFMSTCPICQDDESTDTMVSFPQCSHSIHMQCALQYALYTGYKNAEQNTMQVNPHHNGNGKVSLLCPICRKEQAVYIASGSQSTRDHMQADASGNHRFIVVSDQGGSYDHFFISVPDPSDRVFNLKHKIVSIFAAVGITILVVSAMQAIYASELPPP